MDCPICGGEIPADSDECPTCGESAGESFLKEAFAELANGKQQAPAPAAHKVRPEPSSLKPARHLDLRGMLWLIGGGALVVVIIVIAVIMISGGAKVSSSTPEQAVKAYYQALSRGDLKGMLSLIAEAFQPTETDRASLEKAFLENTYEVSDLAVEVIDNDKSNSRVSIENVVVKIKPNTSGQAATHSLVEEILQPAQRADPGAVMLVRLEFYDETWKIASEPNGGWSPDNIWALGRPGSPTSAP
jgi:uncharacterized membrane protein YvbJ